MIDAVSGAIQAANSSGGWTLANSGNIAIGALTGAGQGLYLVYYLVVLDFGVLLELVHLLVLEVILQING